jgi:glycogen operon protein
MGEDAWSAGFNQCFGFLLAGDLIGEVDDRGQPITGDDILILMNAYYEPIPFRLPARMKGQRWQRLVDTADPNAPREQVRANKRYNLKGRSIVVLRSNPPQVKALEQGETQAATPQDHKTAEQESPVVTAPAEAP